MDEASSEFAQPAPALQWTHDASPARPLATQPVLTTDEREAIDTDRWFSRLSPALRHDILRCSYVKRYKDGTLIAARGQMVKAWCAVAKGAVRLSSTSVAGRPMTLSYLGPGTWFGTTAMFDGGRRTHDTFAHGSTTLLCVARSDVNQILSQHVELYDALLRLQARRRRELFGLIEDISTLPLQARVAKQLLHLVRTHGVPEGGRDVRIGLRLPQVELAQLLCASRQRVNQALRAMEREQAIRIERGGIVVRQREALARMAEADR